MSRTTDGTHPEIPDIQNPFPHPHPLHELFAERVREGQDLAIVVTDYHARRGTGKTVASLQLAEGMDQGDGMTEQKATNKPEKLRNMYVANPNRTSLVLDEGEIGASKYDASSKTNKALRQILSIGRVKEKYFIVNLPDLDMLDPEVRKLLDVWVLMLDKGVGLVHFLGQNPYSNKSQILKHQKGIIQFNDIQDGTRLRDVYDHLTEEKLQHMDGDEGEQFVPQADHEEALRQAREQARQDMRDELIRDIYTELSDLPDRDLSTVQRFNGISQSMLAGALDLSQQQISNIVNDR